MVSCKYEGGLEEDSMNYFNNIGLMYKNKLLKIFEYLHE